MFKVKCVKQTIKDLQNIVIVLANPYAWLTMK